MKNMDGFRQQAIERNYAEYDSQTGEWQWIEQELTEDTNSLVEPEQEPSDSVK